MSDNVSHDKDSISSRRTDAADVSDAVSRDKTADGNSEQKDGKEKKKPRKKRNLWAVKITVVTLFLSAFISFLTEITSSADNIIVTVILLLFLITASILFDGIGVAVTSCDITPIVSMASKKVYGAKTAMWLVKNNEKVANVCNDVIGDIFGIISGACGAAIVVKLVTILDESWQRWLTIAMSSVISALTIGGKAFLKNIAISNSKEFVMFVARIIGVFHPEERKRKKKQAEKKKKYESAELATDNHGSKHSDSAKSDDKSVHATNEKRSSKQKKNVSAKPASVTAESKTKSAKTNTVSENSVCNDETLVTNRETEQSGKEPSSITTEKLGENNQPSEQNNAN